MTFDLILSPVNDWHASILSWKRQPSRSAQWGRGRTLITRRLFGDYGMGMGAMPGGMMGGMGTGMGGYGMGMGGGMPFGY